ncbi:MAG TPA: hypothetical protein EYP57_02950 [Thermodesulfobacteriaceae bacterium]|nr:hypothetical protein [Thermodesulfobacteriaceae bacterium]
MIDVDISLFVEIISVLILMVLLNSMLFKPVRRMLEEREAKMSAVESDIEKYHRNAEQLVENYNNKLAEARAAGQQERDRLAAEAREEERQLAEASSKEAAARKEELLAGLSAQVETARKDLDAKAESFAVEIAQKLLGRAV